MRLAASALLVAGLSLAAGAARAGYAGETIDGTLALGPDGSGGGQYWPVDTIVVPDVFAYRDANNTDSADFTATTLTISDQVGDNANGWEMTFSGESAPFTELSLVSSNFPADSMIYRILDGTIVVDWIGTETSDETFTAAFNLVSTQTSVREPEGLGLFGMGMVGVCFARRKRA